jgi:hypothetical protein
VHIHKDMNVRQSPPPFSRSSRKACRQLNPIYVNILTQNVKIRCNRDLGRIGIGHSEFLLESLLYSQGITKEVVERCRKLDPAHINTLTQKVKKQCNKDLGGAC